MTQILLQATAPITAPRGHDPSFTLALRAGQCAQRVAEGYLRYDVRLRDLTSRAAEHFQMRDWQGTQLDVIERAELFEKFVERTAVDLQIAFCDLVFQQMLWLEVKRHFTTLIDGLADREFAIAFFNAITRRLFRPMSQLLSQSMSHAHPTNFIEHLEFTHEQAAFAGFVADEYAATHCYADELSEATLMQMLQALPIETEWLDLAASARQLQQQTHTQLTRLAGVSTRSQFISIELLDRMFYQFTRAFTVGRVFCNGRCWSLLLVLNNTEEGLAIESVSLGEAALCSLFCQTRPRLNVELDQVTDTIAYLQALMPSMPRAALIGKLGWPVTVNTMALS